jgi:SAM-dependent methyltransferase
MGMIAGPIERVGCPLCAGEQQQPYLQGADHFFGMPGQWQLVRCVQCGLIYQNPRPTRSAIGSYYPDEYGSYTAAQIGMRARRGLSGRLAWRALGQRAALLERHAPTPRAGEPRRLLDIGCAAGFFLEVAQRRGWMVEGVELHEPTAMAVQARLGIRVFAGSFEQANFPAGYFDAVTLWDVLEHLHDPLASMREVRRIIRPGGVVFVRVPNVASYQAKLFGQYWSGYDLPRHLSHFSPKTLSDLLGRAGFRRIIGHYPSGSYPAAVHSVRFWLRATGASAEVAAQAHRRLLNPLLRIAIGGPLRLVDRLLGGSNMEVMVQA